MCLLALQPNKALQRTYLPSLRYGKSAAELGRYARKKITMPYQVINEILNETRDALEAAINSYWPVVNPEKNGLQEANLTFYFAAQCLSHGMHVYPEASHGDSSQGHRRVDLLVRGRAGSDNAVFLVESKKLYSAEKAREIASDIRKICEFGFTDSVASGEAVFGVILAITVNPEIAEWWAAPYECSTESWNMLARMLCDTKSITAVHEIDARYKQYMLLAVFSRREQ